jgi:hypothetical protein
VISSRLLLVGSTVADEIYRQIAIGSKSCLGGAALPGCIAKLLGCPLPP